MGTVHKHSIIQIFIIVSAILIIVADLSNGKAAEAWDTAATVVICAELLCWQLIRKRLPKDPLVKYHKVLDVVCAFLVMATILLKCIILIAGGIPQYGIWIGGGALFVLTILGFYIYFKVTERDAKLQAQIEVADKKNSVLQHAFDENFISLNEFLTAASATENNPALFKENFNRFFNITTNKRGNIFGNLLDVVNENYYHIIDYLKTNYPNLIYEELALCALICLGFSASSIGIIFGNTKTTSIYNRRYRLRKKLAIPAEMQIETFIHNTIADLKTRDSV